MALPATLRSFTEEEYLLLERAADTKSEFLDGQIIAMTGASLAHNVIVMNLGARLHRALEGRPCDVFTSDMRVQVAGGGLYAYPDVVVACEPIILADEHQDTLANPVLIAEVLSPSTAAYDRGVKFQRYQRLGSLRHFLLLAQDEVRVEQFARQDEGWLLRTYTNPSDRLELADLDVALSVGELYVRVPDIG
jgi:Uma2 family endonuclease